MKERMGQRPFTATVERYEELGMNVLLSLL